jgi:hypothetical protein
MKKLRWLPAALLALGMAACGGGDGPGPLPPASPLPPNPPPAPGSAAAITGFSVAGIAGEIEGTTVYVKNVPLYTDETEAAVTNLKNLTPVITHSGTSIDPPVQARNFTAPVTYTVTAADGTAAVWTVIVKLAPATDVAAYLTKAAAVYAGTVADPIPLPVNVSLASGWTGLLSAIQTANKFVALDLSACDISGISGTAGEFYLPHGGSDAGESKIVSLVLPDAATSIKAGSYDGHGDVVDAAFYWFHSLTGVTGSKVTHVGDAAFHGCFELEMVSLPAATVIGDSAFYDCDLETVSLPAAATIGERAFYGCNDLETVSLPAAATIGKRAFAWCSGLKTVYLPASLTTITGNPFGACRQLTAITVDAGNPNYKAENGKLLSKNGDTLIGYPLASGTVTLNGITAVADYAFEGCVDMGAGTGMDLQTVNLPDATTIGDYAFFYCILLETVSLPAAVTIGVHAFSYCSALETVSLPAAAAIGDYAFAECDALHTVNLPAVTTIGQGVFDRPGEDPLTVTLPKAAPLVALTGSNSDSTFTKTVTVKAPANRTGYDSTWEENFKKAFGVSGGAYTVIINLTVTDTP